MTKWLDLNQEQRLWTIRNDNLHIAESPDDIQCPWCDETQGFEHGDVSYEDDDCTDHKCYNCDKTFTIRPVVSYDWRTELPEEYLIEQALEKFPNE